MFHFTIRDVLWLTVVAALTVGWWLEHRGQSRRSIELEAEIRLVKAMAEMRMEYR